METKTNATIVDVCIDVRMCINANELLFSDAVDLLSKMWDRSHREWVRILTTGTRKRKAHANGVRREMQNEMSECLMGRRWKIWILFKRFTRAAWQKSKDTRVLHFTIHQFSSLGLLANYHFHATSPSARLCRPHIILLSWVFIITAVLVVFLSYTFASQHCRGRYVLLN